MSSICIEHIKKIEKLQKQVGDHFQKLARKKQSGHDPNDRKIDHKLQQKIKRLSPEELNELLNGKKEE